jgi:hypothetical protein
MPADCEVDRCGVLAVGRCANPSCAIPGGAAFCASHAGTGYGSVTNLPLALRQVLPQPQSQGWCLSCVRAEARTKQATKQQTEQSVGRMREFVRSAARALVAAGAEPDVRYFHGRTTKTTLFGHIKDIDDPAEDQYGWLIGTYPWSVDKTIHDSRFDTPGRVVRNLRTFVTAGGDLAAQGYRAPDPYLHSTAHPHTLGGYSTARIEPGVRAIPASDLDLWTSVARKFGRLASVHGVSVAAIE